MIANIFSEESEASRCLSMIARCAPKLMRAGGGALPREDLARCRSEGCTQYDRERISPEKKAAVIALALAGKTNGTAIARACDTTQSTVHKILARAGVRVPDGRRD